LPDASCQALVAFIKAAATAAGGQQQQQQQQQQQYDAIAHAILLENLACRGAGRDTVAAALEGLVGLVGGQHDTAAAAAGAAAVELQAR
jgi:hypothetical protein